MSRAVTRECVPQTVVLITVVACLACALSRPGRAIGTALIARADSVLLAGDTASALLFLDSATRVQPTNALAWHRRGMLAWVKVSVYDQRGELVLRDSTRSSIAPSPRTPHVRAWRERLEPGTLIYRVEALEPVGMRAARAMGETRGLPRLGFGVSDLVLAERVQPRGERAERWSDFVVTPSIGVFRRGAPVGLLWEIYWLTERDGNNRYRVSLILEPAAAVGVSGLAARIVDGVRSAVGLSARGDARVELSYMREVPKNLIQVEYLSFRSSPGA